MYLYAVTKTGDRSGKRFLMLSYILYYYTYVLLSFIVFLFTNIHLQVTTGVLVVLEKGIKGAVHPNTKKPTSDWVHALALSLSATVKILALNRV